MAEGNKRKPGRPTRYDPDYHPEKAKELLCQGSTKAGAAAALRINPDTFYRWQNKYAEFSEAVKVGCNLADGVIVSALYKSACGFTSEDGKYYPPNVTSIIFWLKNRRPQDWRDKRHVEADVKVADLSEEELTAKLEAIIKGADK